MAKKDPQGNWITADGNTVPPKFVGKMDKARDAMVERIIAKAQALRKQIVAFDSAVDQEVDKFMAGAALAAGVTRNKGGNQMFTSFSGDLRLEIKVCKLIDFDEKLQFALKKIDNCMNRWSEGAVEKEALRGVIARAFKKNRKGYLDTKLVLGLRNYKVKDREWIEAMELISEAVTITGSKAYKIFQYRDGKGKWCGIPIDISRV